IIKLSTLLKLLSHYIEMIPHYCLKVSLKKALESHLKIKIGEEVVFVILMNSNEQVYKKIITNDNSLTGYKKLQNTIKILNFQKMTLYLGFINDYNFTTASDIINHLLKDNRELKNSINLFI